jgi:hypothetical protein
MTTASRWALVAAVGLAGGGCGSDRPVLDAPEQPAGPGDCRADLEDLRALLGRLAPNGASVAGVHRTLGFDLPAAPEGYATQGATPGPLMVVKAGAVGWLAGGQASWAKGDPDELGRALSQAPTARPTLWWQADSRTGVVTELTRDSKGRLNSAPGVPYGDVPLVAVHPGVPWEAVVGALRGLGAYGYAEVQLLFAASLPDADELVSDRNQVALWHPETGLAPLSFDHDPPELGAVKECAPAYHLLRALPMMDWRGRVRALAVALPQRLEECSCDADIPRLAAVLVAWLNAGDTRHTTVAVALPVHAAALDGLAGRLASRPGAPWSTVVAEALPR